MRGLQYKKAVQMLNLLAIWHDGRLNKMKALKLIWLADRLHLNKYGRTISGDTYYAMKNGPVASAVRNILEQAFLGEDDIEMQYSKEFLQEDEDRYFYRSIKPAVTSVFSKTDLDCLRKVNDALGDKNQFELSDFSHLFPEWTRHEDALRSGAISREYMDLLDFFEPAQGEADLLFEQTLKELAKEIFLENQAVLKALS